MNRNTAVVLACSIVAAASLVAGGCGSGEESSKSSPLAVAAAASLTDVLPEIDSDPKYQFGPSDALATQVREGGRVDVFAAANTVIPCTLHEEGLVEEPVAFAANRIVMIVPKDSKLRSLDDLRSSDDAAIVLARAGVPVGDYAVKVLEALDAEDIVKRVSSHEQDARAVVAKVALGEADAGFGYATDAAVAEYDVRAVELPQTDANHALYAIAVTTAARDGQAAEAFVERVRSQSGQDVLEAAGFQASSETSVCGG